MPAEALLQGRLQEDDIADGHQDLRPEGLQRSARTATRAASASTRSCRSPRRSGASSWKAATPSTSPTRPRKEGVWDLRRAGLKKVKMGMTSLEEINTRHRRLIRPDVTFDGRVAAVPTPWRRTAIRQGRPVHLGGQGQEGQPASRARASPSTSTALRADLRRQGIVPVKIKQADARSSRAAARSTPRTSRSSAASSPPCWPPAFRWCRHSRSSATATTSRRCRS